MEAVPHPLRKSLAIAAGSAALLSATFAMSPFASASDATGTPAPADQPCTLSDAVCADATGTDVVAPAMPDGFSEKVAPPPAVQSDAVTRVHVFESPEKPWIGPGGPVGRRVIVMVRTHAPIDESVVLDADDNPGATVTELGDNPAVTTYRTVPLRNRSGARVDVDTSTVLATVNDRVTVHVLGEGLDLDELTHVAESLEVR